jgi:hypothetical protein
MAAQLKLPMPASLTAWMAVSLCGMLVGGAYALGGMPPRPQIGGKAPLRIAVEDSNGIEIGGADILASSSSPTSASLLFKHEYRQGDRIVLSGPQHLAVKLDGNMPECLLYLADSDRSSFVYEVPLGRAEQQTGSAYAPESFSGETHRIEVHVPDKSERRGYRNLALNPCDLLRPEDGPAQAYPHSSTNSYSRNLYDFAARNAIDGILLNGHHGVWPYQSWGPGLRLDLWWKLEFGRQVELNKIRLMVRADFPHDSYWKSAVVEFSDGSRLPLQIGPSPELQEFPFSKRKVSWFRIANLVPEDPARWCSFIEVEAWGHDLP